MKKYMKLSILAALSVITMFGQATTPTTTLSALLTATTQNVCLAATSASASGSTPAWSLSAGYGLFIDSEYMTEIGPVVGSCVPVRRGDVSPRGPATNHANGSTVYIAVGSNLGPNTGLGNGFSYDEAYQLVGPAVRANLASLPVIKVSTSQIYDCPITSSAVAPNTCIWRLISSLQSDPYPQEQSFTQALTLAQLQALNTAPVLVIAAPMAGFLTIVDSCQLNLLYGSAGFSGGGTVQLSYGAATTYPASATVAANYFTSLSADQVITFNGALANTAPVNVTGIGVYLFGNSANFTSGTGATGVLTCTYHQINGIK